MRDDRDDVEDRHSHTHAHYHNPTHKQINTNEPTTLAEHTTEKAQTVNTCVPLSHLLKPKRTHQYTGHATFASLVLRHPIDAHTICLRGNTYTSVRKRDHATGYFDPAR